MHIIYVSTLIIIIIIFKVQSLTWLVPPTFRCKPEYAPLRQVPMKQAACPQSPVFMIISKTVDIHK